MLCVCPRQQLITSRRISGTRDRKHARHQKITCHRSAGTRYVPRTFPHRLNFVLTAGLAYRASAQVASVCPSSNVCFKLNIPESTASSGSGDIFFQISAPSSYEWVALGQGEGMSGSNIFVVYTSSSGSNVTLSPRTGTGHTMPTSNGDAQVELLEGSGVSNGLMTANVKCR